MRQDGSMQTQQFIVALLTVADDGIRVAIQKATPNCSWASCHTSSASIDKGIVNTPSIHRSPAHKIEVTANFLV